MSQDTFPVTRRVDIGPEFEGFEVFVVGGAVRDSHPEDIDLLAVPRPGEVEAPVDVLEDRMVRIDPADSFPVFRDSAGREVALPRTEESTGQGFHDFDVSLVPPGTPIREAVVTDLERRDLTINAQARNARTDELIDPFGGQDDLRDGVLRHVSTAFVEDPLRVVRLARFAARFEAEIAPETLSLAREVAPRIESVPRERVVDELRKVGKQADRPVWFFRVLKRVDALPQTFPALAGLSVEERHRVHDHLRAIAEVGGPSPRLLFAALGVALDRPRRRVFISVQPLANEEKRVVRDAARHAPTIATLDEEPGAVAIRTAEALTSDGGLLPAEAVDVAAAHASATNLSVDVPTVASRLQEAIDVVNALTGSDLIEQEGVHPGEDISGEAFGELLTQRRADRLSG